MHINKKEHPHYLIFIKVDKICTDRIPEGNFGQNVFPEN